MPIYQRIADLLKFEGSQRKLADKTGMTSSSISNIIKKKQGVRSDTILLILNAYPNLNPSWLLLDKGDMFKDGTEGIAMEPEDKYDSRGEDDMYDEIIKLLKHRVNELEREIKKTNPDLADELNIE